MERLLRPSLMMTMQQRSWLEPKVNDHDKEKELNKGDKAQLRLRSGLTPATQAQALAIKGELGWGLAVKPFAREVEILKMAKPAEGFKVMVERVARELERVEKLVVQEFTRERAQYLV
uniref:Uncharacterized protein n=1 Tax=Oryza sativa subsp. japonica TaxID=39947 RepID=Q8LHI9_ORYSJ|nr:hypothetical protein [Oryza sativa Japonica Group]BAD31090.1 hypothetical protein [Oryza sativa Japonica Group]